MNYDLQIVRAKENLKFSHGGSSQGQASDTNPSMKVLCQGRHRANKDETIATNNDWDHNQGTNSYEIHAIFHLKIKQNNW